MGNDFFLKTNSDNRTPYSIVGAIKLGRVEIFLEVDRLDILLAPMQYAYATHKTLIIEEI